MRKLKSIKKIIKKYKTKNIINIRKLEANQVLDISKKITVKALKLKYSKQATNYNYKLLIDNILNENNDLQYELITYMYEKNVKIYKNKILNSKLLYSHINKILYNYGLIDNKNSYIEDSEGELTGVTIERYFIEDFINQKNDNYKMEIIKQLKLKPKTIEILKVYANNRSYKLTSEFLNISVNTISSTIKRTQKKAQNYLNSFYNDIHKIAL